MYRVRYLPSADLDMIDAEIYLYEYSPSAVDKLTEAVQKQTANLKDYPFMYPVYEKKPYFHLMPLPYEYLCFYHVDENSKTVEVHRILRGMRDIPNTL